MKKVIFWNILILFALSLPGQAELINGDFDENTYGWTPINCTIASVSGYLEMTRTGGANQYVYQVVPTEIGQTYELSIFVASGTSGDDTGRIFVKLDSVPTYSDFVTFSTISSWRKHSLTFIATSPSTRVYVQKLSDIDGNMLFDTAILRKLPAIKVYYTDTLFHEYVGSSLCEKTEEGGLYIRYNGMSVEYPVGEWKRVEASNGETRQIKQLIVYFSTSLSDYESHLFQRNTLSYSIDTEGRLVVYSDGDTHYVYQSDIWKKIRIVYY